MVLRKISIVPPGEEGYHQTEKEGICCLIIPENHMKRLWRAGLLLLCLVASTFLAGLTGADRGGIPIDPTVYSDESAQNAIVAWNLP